MAENAVKRIEVVGTSKGLDELTQELRAVSTAQDQVAKTGETVARVQETSARRQISVADAYRRMQSQLDATVRSQAMFERGQRLLDRTLEQGLIDAQQYATTLHRLKERYDGATIAARANQQAAAALRATLNPLAAAQDQLNAELAQYAALASSGAISTRELAQAEVLAKQRFDATAQSLRSQTAAMNDNRAMRSRMNTGNIAAQFQDIGVTSAMGMNPLQIALQQGTQLSAVLEQMKASGQSAGGALVSAFTSIISPISLVTIGLVAGTAALIQYFATGEEESKSLDKALDAHAETIRALKAAYGEAASGLQEYVKVSRTVAQAQAIIDVGRLQAELKKGTDVIVSSGDVIQSERQQIQGQIQSLMQAFELEGDTGKRLEIDKQITSLFQRLDGASDVARSAAAGFEPFAAAFERFGESTRKGIADYIRLKEEVSEQLVLQPNNEGLRTLAERLFEIIDPGVKAQSALEATAQGIKLAGDQARTSTRDVSGFTDAVRELASIAVPALSDTAKAEEALRKALDAAGNDFTLRKEALADYAETMQRVRNETAGAAVPIPTARPSDIEILDDAAAAADKASKAQDKLTSSYDRTVEHAAERNAQMRVELGSLGDLSAGAETAAYSQQLISQAMSEGRALTEPQIAHIKALAAEYVELSRAMALAKAEQDLQFERDQLGRTDSEQRVYAELRSLGLDINSIDGQRVADNIRINEALAEQRDYAEDLRDTLKEGASNFLHDLFTGKDVMESIVQLGSRLASMNFDRLVDMFSGNGGGFGGLFGGAPAAKTSMPVDYGTIRQTGTVLAEGVAPVLEKSTSAQVQAFMGALKQVESGGNYGARGPMTSYGRPLGAYQVLPENVANWSREFLGRAVTAGEWMKDAAIQDKVVAAKLTQLSEKFPDMRDWAAIWNSGRPLSQSAGVRDQVFGTTVSSYVDKVMGAMPDAVRTGALQGTKQGSTEGTYDAWAGLREVTTPTASSPQQQQNGLGTGLMQGIGAALGGFSLGYQSGNAGMGAIGGALQGFGATGTIFGAVLGGIAGLLGGIFGAQNAVKQARRQLEKQMAQIELLLAVGEGTGIGPVQKRIADYTAETDKVVPLAWKAQDWGLVDRLHESVNKLFIRERTDFYNALPGLMEGYSTGFGRQGPKQQGAEAVFDLREELRGMIADVRYFGQQWIDATLDPTNKQWWLDNHGQERWEQELATAQANAEKTLADAYEAARQMALSFISGPEELTDVQKAIASLNGAAATLIPTLVELGMTAEEAARFIHSEVVAELAEIRDEFEEGLTADRYEATGKGYLNDFKDLFEELENVRKDAALLGTSQAQVDAWFKAMAQSVVDGAQLVGSSFDDLLVAFPELQGVVREFVDGIEDAGTRLRDYEDRLFAATTDTSTRAGALAAFDREANREREREIAAGGEHIVMLEQVLAAERLKIMQEFADRAAERARGFQNRQFAAGNDTSTLSGQLAAFDRAAAQERMDEIKQGGEAIRDLDRALAAERLKIIQDFNKQAAEEEKRRLDEAKSFWESWSKSIKEFIDRLKAGPDTVLAPEDRLAEAQAQFNEQYAKALTGDRDAANSITQYAQNLDDAGKAFLGSTEAFQQMRADLIAKLEALPTQVSAEQFIVDEITDAIDAGTGAVVDATGVMTDTLKAAILAGPRDAAAALALYFEDIDTSLDGLLSTDEFMSGLSGMASESTLQGIFTELDINGDLSVSRLEAMLAAEGLTRSTLQAAILSGPASTAATLSQHFNKLDTSINGLLDQNELRAAIGNLATDEQIAQMMSVLDANGDGQLSQLELIKGATQGTQGQLGDSALIARQLVDLRGIAQEKLTGTNLLLIRALDVLNSSNRLAGGPGGFMSGGYTGDIPVDRVAGSVHGREYVFDAAATARIGVPTLDAMRTGARPILPISVPTNDNRGGMAEMAREIARLHEKLAAIERNTGQTTVATLKGAEYVGAKVDKTTGAINTAVERQGHEALKKTG